VAVLLLLVAVPFAAALTRFTYVEDLTPLMQSTHPATEALIKLGDTFGQDLATPVRAQGFVLLPLFFLLGPVTGAFIKLDNTMRAQGYTLTVFLFRECAAHASHPLSPPRRFLSNS
jgi:hypothetical protein